jgi:hypothetical protein
VSSARRFWVATALIAGSVALVAFISGKVQGGLREATARAAAAERGAQAAETRASEAGRQVLAAQEEAARRLQEAQQAARSAQQTALVAAAADLHRFELGSTRDRGTAQILWSRTHGVAVTARQLAPPGEGHAYQLWLLSPGTATSVGLLTVDGEGRASQVFDPPANLPRPVMRAMITREPSAGSATPTAPAVLVAAPPAAAAS